MFPGSEHSPDGQARWIITALTFIALSGAATLDAGHPSSASIGEYCNMEVFNATCRPNEVIMMDTARYGRMRLGRCVKGNYGFLGCAVDVLPFMDGECSGRHHCAFVVPDPDLYETKPCPGDFTSHLEAAYDCVQVAMGDKMQCHRHNLLPLHGLKSVGYIASLLTEEHNFGSTRCPWIIEADQGQRINVTLLNFARGYYDKVKDDSLAAGGSYGGPQRLDVCFELATIADAAEKKTVTICGGDQREASVFLSKTNRVKVTVTDAHALRSIGKFVLKYQVVSCPDVQPPPDAWAKREGDTLMIRCNTSQETWYLTCRANSWVGEIGNCSQPVQWSFAHVFSEEEIFPYGILVVVAIGVALGVVIGGILLALIFAFSRKSRRRCEAAQYESNKEHMRILDTTANTNGTLGTTTLAEWSRESQYTDEGIVRDLRPSAASSTYGKAGVLPGCGGRGGSLVRYPGPAPRPGDPHRGLPPTGEDGGMRPLIMGEGEGSGPLPPPHRGCPGSQCEPGSAEALSTFRPTNSAMYETPSFT